MAHAEWIRVRGLGRLPLATALIWAALVPAAFAATEVGDAGDLPATAQDLGAETALDSIAGTIENETDRDMYRVCLTGGGSFSASTVEGTAIDTQLFLLDDGGRAVYANDDAPGVVGQSELPAADPLTPSAAGVYYLAITRYNQDPLTADGSRLFADVVFTTGPVSSDPAAAITGWSAGRTGTTGTYTIFLSGVAPCPLPDTTAPTIDLRTPADGASFAAGEVVVVDYDCADEGGSGLASCEGDLADGETLDTSTPGDYGFSVTARDAAGNETSIGHAYTVQPPPDTTAPTIDLRTPVDGATYVVGEQVLADYDCADEGGSGLATCTGDVPTGEAIDTAAAGAHSFTVQATDGAGNAGELTIYYMVEEDSGGGFEFEGFFAPLDDPPPALNRVKAGRDVAVRFRLGGDQGENVFADGFPRSARVDCGEDADPETARPTRSPWWWRQWLDGDVRYNRWTDAYTYLWKTDSDWAGSCRQLIVQFTDGSIQRVNVQFPRRWGHGWGWGNGDDKSRGHDSRARKHRR
jgi:Bacterial pre-peptidase C-terminal domain